MPETRLSRRSCLGTMLAGAAAWGARASAVSAAGQDAPVLGLGFSLYGMKSLPVDRALAVCAQLGYDGVELALMPGWHADPAQLDAAARRALRKMLSDRHLALPALMENLAAVVDGPDHAANLDRLKAAAELAHALAPDEPPVIETVLGGKPPQWDELREPMAQRLADWARVGESAEVTIAVKPHAFGALHLPGDARWLVDQVASPRLKLVYDYSHYQAQGLPLAETVPPLVKDAVFVHVKDAIRDETGKSRFALPGDGPTDYAQLLAALAGGGYRGFVVVEVSAQLFNVAGYDAEAAARRSYENLSAAWTRAKIARPA